MKQIYNFEVHEPPRLSERQLRAELERRRLRLQTMLIALAGILMQAVVVFLAFLLRAEQPILAVLCLGYTVISVTGSSVLAIVATRKGGVFYE